MCKSIYDYMSLKGLKNIRKKKKLYDFNVSSDLQKSIIIINRFKKNKKGKEKKRKEEE